MKFIVFSDSHGVADNMIRAVEIEKPDLCFFLGDGERDLDTLQKRFPTLPVNAVRGNCDVFSTLPQTLVCAAGGIKIFATHGHLYGVKHDPIFRDLCEAAGPTTRPSYGLILTDGEKAETGIVFLTKDPSPFARRGRKA